MAERLMGPSVRWRPPVRAWAAGPRNCGLRLLVRQVRHLYDQNESLSTARKPAMAADWIRHVSLSSVTLPLEVPISDAKVLTGRQRPMTEIAFLFAEVRTADGHEGVGFGYSKRAGGRAQYAHAAEIAADLIGEDPNDIGRLWTKLVWAGASVGRSGA